MSRLTNNPLKITLFGALAIMVVISAAALLSPAEAEAAAPHAACSNPPGAPSGYDFHKVVWFNTNQKLFRDSGGVNGPWSGSSTLGAGKYQVRLVSSEDDGVHQTTEQWTLRVGGFSYTTPDLGGSGSSREDYWSRGPFTLNSSSGTITASFAGGINNSVYAPCAIFYKESTPTGSAPTVDIKANGSNGPITLPVNSTPTISWSTTGNPTTCGASGTWSGTKNVTGGSQGWGPLPAGSYTFAITCSNSFGLDTDTVDVIVEAAAAPTADIKANGSDTAITVSPGNVTISWSSTNATSCSVVGSGLTASGITGSQQVNLSSPGTYPYNISCSGSGGNASDSVTVNVQSINPPTVDIKANGSDGPITIPLEQFRLSWTSQNAVGTCDASGDWFGVKINNGSEFQNPLVSGTYTYTITCSNSGGTDSDSVTVIVQDRPDPVTVDIKANGSDGPVTITEGETVTLSWTSQNATSCSGSWTGGTLPTFGSDPEFPSTTTTYSITCINSTSSDTDTVTVIVTPRQAPTVDIKANGSDGPITVPTNTQVRLSWISDNATSCFASGGPWTGLKALTGSEFTNSLTQTTTFTITCNNGTGQQGSDSVTIVVEDQNVDVDIKANGSDGPVSVPFGQQATLSWDSNGATSCFASGGPWTGVKALTGTEITQSLTASVTFTITCLNSSGASDSDSVTINVGSTGSPTVDIKANGSDGPISIAPGNVTLTWTSDDVSTCSASGSWSGTRATVGSESVNLNSNGSYTFVITCTGSQGSATDTVTVNVTSAPGVSVDIKANGSDGPVTIPRNSQATLSWTSTGASTCNATGGPWTGVKATNGSEVTTSLSSTVTYTITCTGSGGSDTDSVTINIAADTTPTVDIKADGSDGPVTVDEGDTVLLSWTSTNANTCFASAGLWSGTKALSGSETSVTLFNDTTFEITCINGSGASDSDSVTIDVDEAPRAPTVDIKADGSNGPITVGEGSQVRLSWTSTNATTCYADGGPWSGTKIVNGSEFSSALTTSTVFSITCVGSTGLTASDSVVVNVDAAPGDPTVTLTANPTTIDEGATSVLSWTSTNATSCFASGGPWSGTKALNSSEITVALTQTTTFQITCINGLGQSATDTATVTVNDIPDAPTVTLTATPDNVDSGMQSRLSWTSSNTVSCQASGGPWSGTKALSGSEFTQPLTNTVIFSITCVNATGQNVTDTAQVTVNQAPDPITVTLTADPTQLNEGGTTILNWTSQNADQCTASGGPWTGAKLPNNSEAVGPLSQTTTFTITCTNAAGQIAQDTAIVVVNAGPLAPAVDLNANPIVVNEGEQATLSWTSQNANTCNASGGPWSGAKTTGGTEVVGPLTTTSVFSITCRNAAGVEVTDSATVTVIDQPDVPTVDLTANPVTIDEGGSTILTWTSTNATSCLATGGPWSGAKPINGNEISAPLTQNATFTITCTNAAGNSASDTASVIVNDVPDIPTVSLSASPNPIAAGLQTQLTWTSSNTVSCRALSGPWNGAKAVSGSEFTTALFVDSTFTIECENSAGQTVTATATVLVFSLPDAPTVNLEASPTTVDRGDDTILNWTSNNADSCRATAGTWTGVKILDGSEVINDMQQTTAFTITCENSIGETASDTVVVTVRQGGGGGSGNISVNLIANPGTVNSGSQSQLTWNSSNADSCHASGGPWSGTKVTNGSEFTQSLTQTTTFQITCTNNDGETATASATVFISGGGNNPTVNLNANPNFVNNGGTTSLNWTSTNATNCFANGGPWSGNKGLSGNQTVGPLFNTVTFTITCTGNNGQQISDSETVTVGNGGGGNNPTVNINASPNPVFAGGQTQLFWNSTNATNCFAGGGNWSGPKSINGSEFRQIFGTQTFTITCTGTNGQQVSDSVTVTTQGGGGGGIPSVILTANPTIVPAGTGSTLSWSATNVTSCFASGDGPTWNGTKTTSGTQPTGALFTSQSYLITCTGTNGQQVTSQAVVTVGGGGGVTNPPTLNFFAAPISVTPGGNSTLTWTTTNATSCNATGAWSGTKPVNGNQLVGPITNTQSYVMTCTGPGGTVTRDAVVNVGTVLGATSPTLSIFATPSPVAYNTQSTITWNSTNTNSCVASGDWTGTKSVNGTQITIPLTRDSNFTMTCSGVGGTITRTATVPVTGGPIVFVDPGPTVGGATGFYDADITKIVTNLTVTNGNESTVTAWPGNTLQYTITVRNTGTLTLRNLTVKDKLAEELVDVEKISDDGTYDIESRTITWKIPSLAAGASKVLSVTVKVHDCNCSDSVAVPNTATLMGANISDISSNITTAGLQAYPFVIDIDNPSQVVKPGETVTYVVNYRNEGSKTLSDARLDVFIPSGMSIEGHSQNCTLTGNTVGLDIGTIAPGESGRVDVIAKVDEGVLNGEQLTTRVVVGYLDRTGGPRQETSAVTSSTVSRDDVRASDAAIAGAAASGAGSGISFLPHTFWGWLLLLLLIIIVAIFIRRLLAKE